jgi:hypothetical protein
VWGAFNPLPLAPYKYCTSPKFFTFTIHSKFSNSPPLLFKLSLPILFTSFPEMAPVGSRTKKPEVAPTLEPLDNWKETIVFEEHEEVLCQNYDIPPTVRMFYQNLKIRFIEDGEVTLFERMFLAGLRLPFPEIARDLVLFLMVAPSQIMPNAWRYLFASYILWRTVLDREMNILQFFNIYRPRQTSNELIELTVRHPPVFIKLKLGLTNNKFWELQFFRVSGEWECPEGTVLLEN